MTNLETTLNEITMMSDNQMFNWLINKRIFKETQRCPVCESILIFKQCTDGWLKAEWRCMTKTCMHYKTALSPRLGSCFENLAINAKLFFKIVCYWSQGLNNSEMLKIVSVSRPTLSKILVVLIERIRKYFRRNPIRLGGPGIVVNCDEFMMNHKVKNHRGRGPRVKIWALSIVDTSTVPSSGYFTIVENRSKAALLPIIENVVRTGSIIYTDEWASYHDLGQNEGYTHRTVVHKYNFVCPITGVHSQHVESYNNKVMLKVKEKKGMTKEGRKLFVDAFNFLDKFKDRSYEKLLEILAYDYD